MLPIAIAPELPAKINFEATLRQPSFLTSASDEIDLDISKLGNAGTRVSMSGLYILLRLVPDLNGHNPVPHLNFPGLDTLAPLFACPFPFVEFQANLAGAARERRRVLD